MDDWGSAPTPAPAPVKPSAKAAAATEEVILESHNPLYAAAAGAPPAPAAAQGAPPTGAATAMAALRAVQPRRPAAKAVTMTACCSPWWFSGSAPLTSAGKSGQAPEGGAQEEA